MIHKIKACKVGKSYRTANQTFQVRKHKSVIILFCTRRRVGGDSTRSHWAKRRDEARRIQRQLKELTRGQTTGQELL